MATTVDSAINALVDEATTATSLDWLVIDKFNGSSFVTSKIRPTVLGKNVANADLTATGNRSHNFDNFSLEFNKLKDFTLSSTVAPPLGNASFNFNGNGTTSADVVERVKGGTNVIRESYGDKSQRFYGDVFIGSISVF